MINIPDSKHINNVCNKIINPIESGWFIKIIIKVIDIIISEIVIFKITKTKNSLLKL